MGRAEGGGFTPLSNDEKADPGILLNVPQTIQQPRNDTMKHISFVERNSPCLWEGGAAET